MSTFSIRHEHQIHGNTGLIGGTMTVLEMGQGKLVGWHDPDENRAWVLGNKSRKLVDKRINAAQAVARFVKDGDFLAMGGFWPG